MNTGLRRDSQRRLEWPLFRRLGAEEACRGRDVVEMGCGSGYGARLVSGAAPRSYAGFDLMPEQIALAQGRGLAAARFLVADATRVAALGEACADVVLIFGILHHIPGWPRALAEAARLLRPGGRLFVEEPDAPLLALWDRALNWGHPVTGFSLRGLCQALDGASFRLERSLEIPGAFGVYRALRR
jgi:SAM-dependent methyltransferase